ncbi:MAG: phosphatidylserine decarboxylase [Lentisphaeria bacterium]|nr:phosphatidylserine decarboxylase [Lentisphaeria bacterium]
MVSEPVLGDRLLRWAYGGPQRRVLGWVLFRHLLVTRLLGWYADRRCSRGRIAGVIAGLGIDVTEFRDPPGSYRTFNEFFCRHLVAGVRPFDASPEVLCSPADARLLVYPELAGDACIPVKGSRFTVSRLLGPGHESAAAGFAGGSIGIWRLCPADYHRFHYPAAGREVERWQVPGAVHSVNPLVLRLGIDVFAGNLRHVTMLELERFGACACVEVGAFGVAGIVRTHAAGPFSRMAEKGYFRFGGSTLILAFPPGRVTFCADLCRRSAEGVETLVRCGETVGRAASG